MTDEVKAQAIALLLSQWERLGVSGLLAAVFFVWSYTLWRRVSYLTEALAREQRRHIDEQTRSTQRYFEMMQTLLRDFVSGQQAKPESPG